jgi:adenylylsulfate kinase
LFIGAGVIALTAFISPYRADRDRALVGLGNFIGIYCECPVDVCEQRGAKGLYIKARQGVIAELVGISPLCEVPEAPELLLNTASQPLETCVDQVLALLRLRNSIA